MPATTFRSMTNIDGTITPTEDARIPVMDRGFLYGDSIYEVFRTYSRVPLFLDEHYDRLENSARLIYMQITQSRAQLTEEISKTVRATGVTPDQDVYVRYTITRGEGPVDLYPGPDLKTRYVITVKELLPWKAGFYSSGMTMAIPAVRRNPRNALDPNIKGGNYLNNVIAITEARALGADDCVILNEDNFVTEAANSNVFFVIDGQLVTPGGEAGNLGGLTKKAVHQACSDNNITTIEKAVHVDDLVGATECFVTSATREVMPVRSLRLEDGSMLSFPEGGGEMTRKVHGLYRDYIAAHVQAHAELALY